MGPDRGVLAESWRRTVERIDTVLGQLAYLASLRNPNTGEYEHFGLAERVGGVEVDRLLRRSHVETFQRWLCFGLRRQREELERYFSEQEGDRREVLTNWLSISPYTAWVPSDSRDVERKLFSSDIEIVLDILRVESGLAARDPDS